MKKDSDNNRGALRWLGWGALALMLSGCGAAEMVSGTVKDLVVGKSEAQKVAEKAAIPKIAELRIEASEQLNVDAKGNPLSVVVRLYRLKDANTFLRSSYDTLSAPSARVRESLSDDLVDMKEVVIVPGGRYQTQERFVDEARFLGVAVLFRTPDANRWRYVFSASDVAKTGVVLGLHNCAISVAKGAPVGVQGRAGLEIANSRCQPAS